MVLLEKLNKLEATISEQGSTLGKIQEATSLLDPDFLHSNQFKSPFSPIQQKICPTEVFQIPKGRWAGLEHFMSLPFVATLLPPGRKYENIFLDNFEIQKDCKLPNLNREHIQKLVDHYLASIHPLHTILEVTTIEQMRKELDENGLFWTGETAIIMHLLAIGSVLSGLDSSEYHSAAKRRMGFAVERINVMAIQAHYLQGYVLFEAVLI
jgi:hypothetical protein